MLVLALVLGGVGQLDRFLDCHLGDPALLDAFIALKAFPKLDPPTYMVFILARLHDLVKFFEAAEPSRNVYQFMDTSVLWRPSPS